MSTVWRHDGTEWQMMSAAGFEDEKALHQLVEEAPEMLPLAGAPRLVIVGSEVQLGSGFADLIAIEPSGRPVIIEIKLGKNNEARRAVVAQALSYAAYLNLLTAKQFETAVVAKHLSTRGWDSLAHAIESTDQAGSFDDAAFHSGLDDAFARGAFRIVFVLDSSPDELVRLVGYLELVAERVQIDLITVEAYEVDGSRVLIPQRVDPERVAAVKANLPLTQATKKPETQPVPGADLFESSIQTAAPEHQPFLETMSSWARNLEMAKLARLFSTPGVNRCLLVPRLTNEDVGLVTLWNDNGASVALWRSVFLKRAPEALVALDAYLPSPVGAGTSTRDVTVELLELLTAAYTEAKATTTQGFDWTIVKTAIEAISPGWWTTYGDLAALAGTAAQPVANYVAKAPGLVGAWRVLTANGTPSPGFTWGDPDDTRDVREVLEHEGLCFTGDTADPSRRVDLTGLKALIGTKGSK